MAKILLVEDETDLAEAIVEWLQDEHYMVEHASTGSQAAEMLASHAYDLVLLDWMLPDVQGVDVCKQFRRERGAVPILILTAKASLDAKEEGLDAGADDYLTKPFQLRELSARVRALLRRPVAPPSSVLKLGALEMDRFGFTLKKNGTAIHLLPKEFALLELFLLHPGRVFSMEELLDRIWGSDTQTLPETVRSTVRGLRNKIDEPDKPSAIKSVYGSGYKLEEADL